MSEAEYKKSTCDGCAIYEKKDIMIRQSYEGEWGVFIWESFRGNFKTLRAAKEFVEWEEKHAM